MLKAAAGVMDGIGLGALIPGQVYELPRGAAEHLMALGAARALVIERGAIHVDDDESLVDHITQGVRVTIEPLADAADKPPPRRPTKKRP